MKLLLVAAAVLVGLCSAGRLEHTYLPPSKAQTSGGSDESIQAPEDDSIVVSARGPVANEYLPPTNRQYLPPSDDSVIVSARQSSSRQYLPPSASSYSAPEPIVKYINEPNAGDGAYNFEYETANGIKQEERGHLEGEDEEVVEGSYSYTGPDGVLYTVHYRADANGFHATGDHLPTPPPVPEAIQRSLELNAAAEAARQAQGQGYQYGPGKSAGGDDNGYKY